MNWFYRNREERSKWLAERFINEIKEADSIIDVGCYNKDLQKSLPKKIKYTGIDIAGKPDLFINLDEVKELPFEDDSFDIAVCADVLEHLENIHFIFDELCRITNKSVIITLPNAYASIPEFLKGKKYTRSVDKRKNYGKFNKYYGLPLEKPDDRHRWFFSYDEAVEFVKYRGHKYGFKLVVKESDMKYPKSSFLERITLPFFKLINRNLVGRHIILMLKRN